MDVVTALRTRSSIRAFKPDPVDDATLRRVLDAAREAPSWKNTQPYRLAVASGEKCEALRAEMLAAIDSRVPDGDFSMIIEYPPPLKERTQATGYGLYAKLGIQREDREARAVQFRKNWAFFGAPVVMFLFVHDALREWAALDAGIYLEALMLAATNEGLGTCPQASLGTFPDIVRKHFEVPPSYKLLCGIALGYAAEDVVNTFRPARLSVDEILLSPLPWSKAG
jgi:nitroreductase